MDKLRANIVKAITDSIEEHSYSVGDADAPIAIIDSSVNTDKAADQILAFIKEAGYVKLADDQSLPSYELPDKPLAQSEWWSGYATGHIEGKEAMLKAGFRKVEL